ncbi:MAG: polysaccharide deacetylase family protein [Acidimicrobiales bacterium]|nr:polysaccharide deacetylase family protein [Acidimicrobiales bacterium]
MHRRHLLLAASAALVGASTGARPPHQAATDPDDDEIEDPRKGAQEILWSVETVLPVAALTFDDGPHPDLTPPILDVLDRYGVKATFMVMGHCAEQYPDILREVVARGHEVGHHTWRHLHVTKTSSPTTREEIEVGTQVVEDVAGVPVHLFRPPQGRLSEAVVRVVAKMDQDVILWSVTRGRKRWQRPQQVAEHVVDETGTGDIIDLHDGIGRGTFEPASRTAAELMARRKVEVAALPRIIEGIQAKGVRLGTVTDLRAVRRPKTTRPRAPVTPGASDDGRRS